MSNTMRDEIYIASLLAQVLSLGTEIYRLEERLRADPPTDPETLQKYVTELADLKEKSAGLYGQIRVLLSSSKVTAEELATAFAQDEESHAMNLKTWTRPAADPVWPPAEPPPTVAFETYTWYAAPIPDDSILKTIVLRGLKWTSSNGDQWAVTPSGGAAMGVDPQGNPAVEVGPIK